MTSPVDFISGPRRISTPGKRANGNTASLTATWPLSVAAFDEDAGVKDGGRPKDFSVSPAITRAAILATGTPVALATKGTVRLARGLTSRI